MQARRPPLHGTTFPIWQALLAREATRCGASSGVLLAQADDGPKASNFWCKQKLRATPRARELLHTLHGAAPKLAGMYEGSTPMAWSLPTRKIDPCMRK